MAACIRVSRFPNELFQDPKNCLFPESDWSENVGGEASTRSILLGDGTVLIYLGDASLACQGSIRRSSFVQALGILLKVASSRCKNAGSTSPGVQNGGAVRHCVS